MFEEKMGIYGPWVVEWAALKLRLRSKHSTSRGQ